MERIVLKNVGDGLHLLIKNDWHVELVVDFGGDENIDSCHYPYYQHIFSNSFMLTHFHADHYNGILGCQDLPYPYWNLDYFYHPAMPTFAGDKDFLIRLLAMNIRISDRHPIQSTIMDLVQKLNRKPVRFQPVSKGDVILCGKRKYEILWPPKTLTDKEALTEVRNAMADFEKARESDGQLSEIYQRINSRYSEKTMHDVNPMDGDNGRLQSLPPDVELPELVQKANKSMRRAANRLSIAFRQEDNILFLGDLESREINSVAGHLVETGNTVYDILVAAHHGTHWEKELLEIHSDICLASIGKTLQKHMKYEYTGISNRLVRTDEWGDICVSQKNHIK